MPYLTIIIISKIETGRLKNIYRYKISAAITLVGQNHCLTF